MAVTAQDIITRALRKIGAIDAIEVPTAEEMSDALGSLNDVLGAWSITRGLITAQTKLQLPLTGLATYTLGEGGTLNITRPVRIESAFVREGGIDNPVGIEPIEYFDVEPHKSEQGVPCTAYVRYGNPLVELSLFPVPSSGVLHMNAWMPVDEISDAYADLEMPRYFASYLRMCLQIDLAPDYGRAIEPMWEMQRQDLRTQITAVHGRRSRVSFDMAIQQRGAHADFHRGD